MYSAPASTNAAAGPASAQQKEILHPRHRAVRISRGTLPIVSLALLLRIQTIMHQLDGSSYNKT